MQTALQMPRVLNSWNGVKNDATRIEQLEAQVESLEAKAQAELDARIEIAKAESNKQGVTVNTGK